MATQIEIVHRQEDRRARVAKRELTVLANGAAEIRAERWTGRNSNVDRVSTPDRNHYVSTLAAHWDSEVR